MYALLVDGQAVADFDDWPEAWDRGDRPSAETAAPAQVRAARRPEMAVASTRWLARYRAGECEAVWAEMLSLGADVRDRTHRKNAVAVVRETMRHARYNVQTIIRTVDSMGYTFGEGRHRHGLATSDHLKDTNVFLPAERGDRAVLDEWE